eukprot:380706-Amphidinium_carterae.1
MSCTVPRSQQEVQLLMLLKDKDTGLQRMQENAPNLHQMFKDALELKKLDNVCPDHVADVLNGRSVHKAIWRAVSLETIMGSKSLLSDATYFESLGSAFCWRLAQRVWMQSEGHVFNNDICFVLSEIDADHEGMCSTRELGSWTERTRFSQGQDSDLQPLIIVQLKD